MPYRLAADACSALIARMPALEGPFVWTSRRLWSAPVAGRFIRSVTYRYIARLPAAGSRFRPVTVEGIPMTADVTHFVFSGNYFGAVPYEAHLTRYFADHLRAGSVFVDVGANCGYFSLLAAGLTGASGRIFAFEPNPPVFDELSRHVQLNSVGDRVRMFKLALSDARVEGVPLFVSPLQSGLSTFITQRATSEQCFGRPGTVSVETVTFDEWREHESVDHVDLMKIDVEGFEAQVLAGMIRSLRARRIRRIVCETTWDSPAHRLLVDAGFKPRFLENVGSVDNIAYELPGD